MNPLRICATVIRSIFVGAKGSQKSPTAKTEPLKNIAQENLISLSAARQAFLELPVPMQEKARYWQIQGLLLELTFKYLANENVDKFAQLFELNESEFFNRVKSHPRLKMPFERAGHLQFMDSPYWTVQTKAKIRRHIQIDDIKYGKYGDLTEGHVGAARILDDIYKADVFQFRFVIERFVKANMRGAQIRWAYEASDSNIHQLISRLMNKDSKLIQQVNERKPRKYLFDAKEFPPETDGQ